MRRQKPQYQRQLRHRLVNLRQELQTVHLTLLATEQHTYEHIYGRIETTEQLLELMWKDPWFTWLHPLSDMLVRIDYLLNDEAFDITDENVEHLFEEARLLLHPSIEGDGFERAYYEALQRAPDVVLAHFHLTRTLLTEAA
ncbi:MAG: hypothetical protein HOP32_17695 [Nitrospira sp.]|nr:hypothetical protein [Nitrospira sp.]